MNLTTETFTKALGSNNILIVDFWADWCGPCLKVAPILDEISSEYNATIVKVHVDENPELSSKYEVSSIPTIMVFEKGIPVKKLVGAYPKHKLVKELEGWL
jgi:thioredoxin 1